MSDPTGHHGPRSVVTVHSFDLDDPPLPMGRLVSFLDAKERRRAERFHFDRDRDRWAVGRGLLRVVLAREARCRPHDIAFLYGRHGKPRLADSGPVFNVSHSERLLVVALGGDGATGVGVDVEVVRTIPSFADVARRVFIDSEIERMLPLETEDQRLVFHRHWAAKEAVMKVLGTGFTLDPLAFGVSFRSDGTFDVTAASPDAPTLPSGGAEIGPMDVPGSSGTRAAGAVVSLPSTPRVVVHPLGLL